MPVSFGRPQIGADTLKPELIAKSRHRRETMKGVAEREDRSSAPRNDLRPELLLVERRLDELKTPKRQVRKQTPEAIADIANSIRVLGFSRPILTSHKNRVIDGAAVIEAARMLGLETVPCIEVSHLTEAQEQGLRLALNKIGQNRPYDLDELKIELEELISAEVPIINLGFTSTELDQILLERPQIEKGEPDPPMDAVPVSRLGDLWQLGDHRLLCGDAKETQSYEKLLQGEPVQLSLTDPPYGVAVGKIVSTNHRDFVEGGGDMTEAAFDEMIERTFALIRDALVDGGLLFCFMDWKHVANLIAIGKQLGLSHLNLITWVKHQGGMGSLYRSRSEFVVALKKPGKHKNNIQLGKYGRDRTNVWEYAGAGTLGSDAREMLKDHPTPKPVQMLIDALIDVTDRGDVVLDPFGGSGSTLMACEATARCARLIELDPLYCDLTVRRWEQETGKRAKLEGSGESFDIVHQRRMDDGAVEEADNEG